MKKVLSAAAIAVSMTFAAAQPAAAIGYGHGPSIRYIKPVKHFKPFKPFKPYKPIKPIKPPTASPTTPKSTTHVHSGSPSWVPQYVFAATACSAVFLWVQALHTSRTERRELTQKEAWTTVGNCFLPIIGGYIMGSLAQQP